MHRYLGRLIGKSQTFWVKFWMKHAGLTSAGRMAMFLASLAGPPYKAASYLARMNARGYIAPTADIHHKNLQLGAHIFIGDRVIIYQADDTGQVRIGAGVHIHRDTIIETGMGGGLTIGDNTHIQPRCQFSAYVGSIIIGSNTQIAPNCAFYPYNHSFASGELIRNQPIQSKGNIKIEDDAWLGVGVIVLDGVTIGEGGVVGAGSVVTRDIPAGAIAAGNPARVIGKR